MIGRLLIRSLTGDFHRKLLMAKNQGVPLHLRFAKLVLWLLRYAILIAMALVLLPLAIPYLKAGVSHVWLDKIQAQDAIVIKWVQAASPVNLGGFEITRWILVGLLYILRTMVAGVQRKLGHAIYRVRVQRDVEAMQAAAQSGAGARLIAPIREKIKKLDPSNDESRAELLQVMAEAKRKLESMSRDLAFLSIDVAESTSMKIGEDKTDIEHDFREYKNLVDSRLRSNGSLKAAWTPDGVMACFPTSDAAVKAAQEVIAGLDAFNSNVKLIRANFAVRCGINAGRVYYDEATPMEEMSDRVIDIAGHMQKYAQPDTIACPKQLIKPVQQREGFKDAGRVVDGYETYQWTRD